MRLEREFNMKDFVSMIVPIYNKEPYLKQCIDSILHQTYQNLEIILIDDGSIDNSFSICKEYAKKDKRIKLYHQENKGVSEARNKGLKHATGEYLSFVDADDFIEPNMIENMLKKLKTQQSDIVVCNFERMGKSYYKKEDRLLEKSEIYEAIFYTSCCNKLYKKTLFKKEKFGNYSYAEDMMLNFHILKKVNKIYFNFSSVYYHYNNHSNSLSNTNNLKKLESLKQLDEMIEFLKENKLDNLYQRMLVYHFILFGETLYFVKQKKVSKEDLKPYEELFQHYKKEIKKEKLSLYNRMKVTLFLLFPKQYSSYRKIH